MSGNSTPRKGTPINNPIKRKLFAKSTSSSSHDLLSPINTLDSKLPARKFENPVPENRTSLPPRKHDNPLIKRQLLFPLKTDKLPGAFVKAESSSDVFKNILENYPKGTFTTENDEKEALNSFAKKHVNILSESDDDEKAVDNEIRETFERDTFYNDIPARTAVNDDVTDENNVFDISAYMESPKKLSNEKDLANLNVPVNSFFKPRPFPTLKIANAQYRSIMLPPTRSSHDFRDLQLIFVTKERYFSLSAFVNNENANIIVSFVKISRIQLIAQESLSSGEWYIDFVLNSLDLNFKNFGVAPNLSTVESLAFEECNTLRINLAHNCGMSKDSIENLLLPMLRDRNALQVTQKRDPYGEFEKTPSPKKHTPIRSSLHSSGTIRAVPSLESLASSDSVKISPSAVKRASNSIFQSSPLYSPDIFDALTRRTSKRLRAKTSPEKQTSSRKGEDSVYIDPEFETARVVLFTYPEGQLDSVYVTSHELERLSPGIWLNDTNIDFELKYLLAQLEPSLQDKIHIFSSFFYRRLSSAKLSMSPSQQDDKKTGYDMVKSWTRKINLFEKDFIVVPINENLHWFLAIICHPSKMLADIIEDGDGKTDNEADTKEKEEQTQNTLLQEHDSTQLYVDLDPEPVESTKIYIFDSLGLASRGKGVAVINRLRTYLQLEAQHKLKRATSKSACTGHVVKVPQQDNYNDCGCFLLQFAEEFFKGITSGIDAKISEHNCDLSDWFPSDLAQSRREVMRKRVEQLAADYAQREKLRNDANPSPTPEIEDRSSDIEEIIMLPAQ